MKLDDLQKALELAKASLATKKIPKMDTDKLQEDDSTKMRDSKHMNGKNVEQYNHIGEKMLDLEVNRIAKDEAADLEAKIKAKKEQYKNINTPMADPMKVNTKLAAKAVKMKKEEGQEPDMASPDQPEGLKGKRKPVTHDECGRPFAKDELDEKIKAKMKAEMDKRKFGEADATKHVIDRDRGEKTVKQPKIKPLLNSIDEKNTLIKALSDAGHRESALLLKNWDELDKTAEAFFKSNYGPKGMGLYNQTDNAKRKAKNTGESFDDIGQNKNTKKYTTSGSSMSQVHEDTQQKKYNKEAKSKVKQYTPEEIETMNRERGLKKSDPLPETCKSCGKGKPKFKAKNKEGTWWDCPNCKTTGIVPAKDLLKQEVAPKGSNNRDTYLKEFEDTKMNKDEVPADIERQATYKNRV